MAKRRRQNYKVQCDAMSTKVTKVKNRLRVNGSRFKNAY